MSAQRSAERRDCTGRGISRGAAGGGLMLTSIGAAVEWGRRFRGSWTWLVLIASFVISAPGVAGERSRGVAVLPISQLPPRAVAGIVGSSRLRVGWTGKTVLCTRPPFDWRIAGDSLRIAGVADSSTFLPVPIEWIAVPDGRCTLRGLKLGGLVGCILGLVGFGEQFEHHTPASDVGAVDFAYPLQRALFGALIGLAIGGCCGTLVPRWKRYSLIVAGDQSSAGDRTDYPERVP
jgi:hypothetical protein